MEVKEVSLEKVIHKVKCGRMSYFEVPQEYRLNEEIVRVQREKKIRTIINKGFDILKNSFFVKEGIGRYKEKEYDTHYLSSFDEFFRLVNGDIYSNACYYGYEFLEEDILKYNIDLTRINKTALITETISQYTKQFNFDKQEYEKGEKKKKKRKKILGDFLQCNTYSEFKSLMDRVKRCDLDFYVQSYVCSDNEHAFDVIMESINNQDFFIHYVNWSSCYDSFGWYSYLSMIFGTEKVFNACYFQGLAESTIKKKKRDMRARTRRLNMDEIEKCFKVYFDDSHYFCYSEDGYFVKDKSPAYRVTKYFETFDELAEFLDNDLSFCDLSNCYLPNVDFSKFKSNEKTILPPEVYDDLNYSVSKWFDRITKNFIVDQTWENKTGISIKSERHSFEYFFDFVYFLENDLSNAGLYFCLGLENIKDFSVFNLDNVDMLSHVCDIANIEYKQIVFEQSEIGCDLVLKNELETEMILKNNYPEEGGGRYKRNLYITDLHLLHRLEKFHCKNRSDVIYYMMQLIDDMFNDNGHQIWGDILLIGGDVSSDYFLFDWFVRVLCYKLCNRKVQNKIFFVLGNHELWGWEIPLNKIVEKYREMLASRGVYLLHNEIMYIENNGEVKGITTKQIETWSVEEIRAKISCAREILFGGIGFSGQNEEFNANNGIYRGVINREREIKESKKFDRLYRKVCCAAKGRRVVVLTHMPFSDWCSQQSPMENFVYVSGHNHRNYFYDDGVYRFYSDNQVGYYGNRILIKYFDVENSYDCFDGWEDGIYEINRDNYIDFYRGKNIQMQFTRKMDGLKLWMLKKEGFYLFLLEENERLYIMHGGNRKTIPQYGLEYFYKNMNRVISQILTPLNDFTDFQKKIAKQIKRIGGSGKIHGAIIDIDYYNHIYVNPIDYTVRPYFAENKVWKRIYPDIVGLLEKNCPQMYLKYQELLGDTVDTGIVALKDVCNSKVEPEIYLETDIYKASGEIKKMQNVYSSILTEWIEDKKNLLG